ncbi:hypothetical protein [Nostoc sp. FACHB-280]|uniref:hypothetical protein n=1 Tax=Nostoc sp. FACHB-280 TaxID=2692839 RepID=UPI00168ADFAF|nr:hypothetical protein [Nostoc sp. FACHB-280]MBD2494163.1 hypothetical protein [Nostoc sp. FACHB-280]
MRRQLWNLLTYSMLNLNTYQQIYQKLALLNISLLKPYRIVIGAMLLAMTVTACDNSAKSQLIFINSPSATKLSDNSNSSPPLTSTTQKPVDTKSLEQQAIQVIHDYYDAIATQDYKKAYLLWDGDGAASKQSFDEFKRGFANTASVAEEIGKPDPTEGAAGSLYIKIPVTVTAVTTNGTPQRFHGSYVLRRVNNVPGSTPKQRSWHIYSANISQEN